MAATYTYSEQQILDGSGDPIVGAKLEAWAAGTSTELATYSDNALTSANANPAQDTANPGSPITTGNQIANASGRFGAIYLQPLAYKFILKNASGTVIWTHDNYVPDGGTTLPSYTTTNIADVAHAANTDNKAKGKMIYNETLATMKIATGALTTSTWKDADGTNTVTPS